MPRGTSETMPETTGDRLYMIRLACGGGARKPASLAVFAAFVEERTGAHYDPSTISLLERMEQTWRLADLETFASVDPRGRGPAWLAWGEQAEPATLPERDARPDYVIVAEKHGIPVHPGVPAKKTPRKSGAHHRRKSG